MKMRTTWVESSKILWALADSNGVPIITPKENFKQSYVVEGKEIEHTFKFKEFGGEWKHTLKSHIYYPIW